MDRRVVHNIGLARDPHVDVRPNGAPIDALRQLVEQVVFVFSLTVLSSRCWTPAAGTIRQQPYRSRPCSLMKRKSGTPKYASVAKLASCK